jgi:carbon storage regulator
MILLPERGIMVLTQDGDPYLFGREPTMLVLTRKIGETIVIDQHIRVTVLDIRGNQVRLGFAAPDSVKIQREELCFDAPTVRPATTTGSPAPAP